MEQVALKAHIKTGKFDPFYIFTGPEVKVMDIYLEQIAKVYKAEIKVLDSVADLMRKAHTRSMLSSRFVYVLRDSKEFISDSTLQAKLTQSKAFGDAILVFIYTTIDKRSKLYKGFKDHIIDFEPMRESVLLKYVTRAIDMSEMKCKNLIEVCEQDYSRILLEIDKIQRYAKSAKITSDDAFTELLNDGTIYLPPRDAVFDFVDAVLKYKPKLAFRLLAESYASGEATMVLLSNLYNSAKQLLQVQSYKGDGKICEVTGLTPFQVKLASGRKGYYSNGDLVYLMRITRAAEKGIKTGEIEDSMAVPYILVNLW